MAAFAPRKRQLLDRRMCRNHIQSVRNSTQNNFYPCHKSNSGYPANHHLLHWQSYHGFYKAPCFLWDYSFSTCY